MPHIAAEDYDEGPDPEYYETAAAMTEPSGGSHVAPPGAVEAGLGVDAPRTTG